MKAIKATMVGLVLATLSTPTQADGGLDGTDVVKLSDHEMRKLRGNKVSMIFQEPMSSLNPVYTVGWQIGEAGTFTVPVTSPLQGAVREDPVEKRIYVGVDDVSATLADVVRSGGSIDQARFEVPSVAVLGLFRDPAGNPMGLIELESGSPKVP